MRASDSQWFTKPDDGLNHPVGGDLLPDRRSDRGLAFAAISLALVGVAAAGTYFFFGIESRTDTPVSTTTVTNAALPEPTPTPPPPAIAEASELAPWEPPVVDAVKAPNLPNRIEGAQIEPPRRAPAKAKPRSDLTPPVDEAALERAGFYRTMTPDPATNAMVAPPPAPSPPTTPNSEMVPPLTTPPVIDGPAKTTLPDRDAERDDERGERETAEPESTTPMPAPTDTLPEVQIKE
ncbi:MAG: hypothetical protein KIT84_21115 [Labilithrix sp.]|nr:hypothetical protein [Labilithrix sp.]MCW5813543.1 hypothetical protein [Labilithrix sp.]